MLNSPPQSRRAQAFTIRRLFKCRGQTPMPEGELFSVAVAVMAACATAELVIWKKTHQLNNRHIPELFFSMVDICLIGTT